MSGRKVFAVGEVLQAADVNDFLMDQSVMVFAGTAARGSAIPSPTEGMVTYRSDDDVVEVFDGSVFKAVGPGQILQVVSTTKTDTFTASVAAFSNVAVTGLSATITPSSTSSKILIHAHVLGTTSNANFGIGFLMFRGATQIGLATSAGSRNAITALSVGGNATDGMSNPSITHLDTPSTTSATTYSINLLNYQGLTQNIHLNRTSTDSDTGNFARGVSSITLMEVAG